MASSGGLVPLIGLSISAATGKIYAGLYYPTPWPGLPLSSAALRYARPMGLGFGTKSAAIRVAFPHHLFDNLADDVTS